MFWRKKNEAASLPVSTVVPTFVESLPAELESSLETTAEILRVLGRDAFDVGELPAAGIADTFERWAKHVLVVGRAPGNDVEPSESAPPPRREWRKLARFVGEHRKKERQHVVQTTADMRDAIRAFVQCLGSASLEHGKTSKTLRAKVDRLRASVESNSLEELKASALGVAEAVTQVLEIQERRMQEQARELREKLSKLQDDLEQAKTEGSIDALTKLQNRRAFDAALSSSVALAAILEQPVSLVMIDADHFKSINDRYGHPVGDRVLRAIADAITRSFPRRNDVVARCGGEEFACLVGASHKDASRLTDRLMTAIRNLEIEHEGQTITVTVSAGIGELRRGETGEELVARVDRALYEAKAAGRNRVSPAR